MRTDACGFRYLDVDDLCMISAEVLNMDLNTAARVCKTTAADSAAHAPAASFGGIEFYTTLPAKTAVLGYRILRNHPFVDGNKRTALLAMVELAERNGGTWADTDDGPDDTAAVLVSAAGSDISETAFAEWVGRRVQEQ